MSYTLKNTEVKYSSFSQMAASSQQCWKGCLYFPVLISNHRHLSCHFHVSKSKDPNYWSAFFCWALAECQPHNYYMLIIIIYYFIIYLITYC